MRDLFPVMERLITDSFRAVYTKIDTKRAQNSFEILGYDFMIDENFKVKMIEANTNPCLEICCPLLARIMPELLDNTFRIAVDPIFQPPSIHDEVPESGAPDVYDPKLGKTKRRFELMPLIKYRLIFDELADRVELERELGRE